MRHVIVSSLLAGVAFFASTSAQAFPMQDVQCRAGGAPLKNAPNGMGMLFDAGCTTAYVMPPEAGMVNVTALTAEPNVQYCPAVIGLHTQVDAALAQVTTLQAQIDAYLADFDRLQANVEALQEQLAIVSAARTQADTDWANAVNTKIEFQQSVADAQSDYDDCVLIASVPECVSQSQALANANATLASYVSGTYNPAQVAANAADAQYTQVFNAYSAALDQLNAALDPILQLEAQLDAVNQAIEDQYATYAALEGATGTLSYSVPWDPLIAAYRAANPLAGWTFTSMPITAASFAATAIVGGDPTTIPALLWATYPGDGADGGTAQDAGMRVMGRGGLVTATIGLGLAGACPFFPDGQMKPGPVTVDRKGLAAYVTANAIYHYSVYVRRTFVTVLSSSTLIAKLKKILPTFDPLGPTPLAALVRNNVEAEALKVDLTAETAQHVALDSQIQSLTSDKITLTSATLTKAATTGLVKPGLTVDPVPLRPGIPIVKPPIVKPPIHIPIKPPIIVPPILKPVYQAIDTVGELTFVP